MSAEKHEPPSSADPSERPSQIKYGAALSYDTNAEIYINPETELAHLVTRYTERNGDGVIVSQIVVSSDLSPMRDNAKLSFKVAGTIQLVLSPTLSASVPGKFEAAGWQSHPAPPLPSIAKAWILHGKPEQGSQMLAISGPPGGGEFSFTVSGASLKQQKTSLVGILAHDEGIVGLAAEVHLPSLR